MLKAEPENNGLWQRLAFFAKRAARAENQLAEMSVGNESLCTDLAGQSVAIVGNSRALGQSDHGAAIDGAHIVVRMNGAPMPDPSSHGQRTTWLALAISLTQNEQNRINPARILWMSPKRKRLPFWVASSPGFYLHPRQKYQLLTKSIGAPASTGIMVIDLIAGSQASSIDLYGFDFFVSKSLTGSRSAAQVPHDFDAEKRWVGQLCDRDPRISVN